MTEFIRIKVCGIPVDVPVNNMSMFIMYQDETYKRWTHDTEFWNLDCSPLMPNLYARTIIIEKILYDKNHDGKDKTINNYMSVFADKYIVEDLRQSWGKITAMPFRDDFFNDPFKVRPDSRETKFIKHLIDTEIHRVNIMPNDLSVSIVAFYNKQLGRDLAAECIEYYKKNTTVDEYFLMTGELKEVTTDSGHEEYEDYEELFSEIQKYESGSGNIDRIDELSKKFGLTIVPLYICTSVELFGNTVTINEHCRKILQGGSKLQLSVEATNMIIESWYKKEEPKDVSGIIDPYERKIVDFIIHKKILNTSKYTKLTDDISSIRSKHYYDISGDSIMCIREIVAIDYQTLHVSIMNRHEFIAFLGHITHKYNQKIGKKFMTHHFSEKYAEGMANYLQVRFWQN